MNCSPLKRDPSYDGRSARSQGVSIDERFELGRDVAGGSQTK
jgi:hypothetical protein